jgi:hypothetical protein
LADAHRAILEESKTGGDTSHDAKNGHLRPVDCVRASAKSEVTEYESFRRADLLPAHRVQCP